MMKVLQAVEEALRKSGTPMHVQDLTNLILTSRLWQSSGKTPGATVSARLYADIKKHGDKSKFIQTGPQTFALRDCSDSSDAAGVKDTTGHSFTECARMVLEQYGKKKPLHYREITQKALDNEWLVSEGKTPEVTTYA